MTPLAPHLTEFLCERLPRQRGASEHTCDSYAYAFQLLLQFASGRLRVTPSALSLEQLDAPLVMDFCNISKPPGTTVHGPAMPGWSRSNPLCAFSSTASRHC